MKFRAVVLNEETADRPYFVYIESEQGATMACRFQYARHAERVANAMNKAFEGEEAYLVHGEA